MTTTEDFWRLDATGLAAAIRAGAFDPSAVLEATFARIDAINPSINAVVTRFDDRARAQLSKVDPNAPFAYVPFLIKETTFYEGERMTAGSRWLSDVVAPMTDPMIAAFESMGFIAVGISNAPEFGLTDVTEPLIFGATRNPWNTDYTAGGSSGGAAAAVAAGLVPFAHGSDGGGSLRAPASHCGLFTLKTSRNRPTPMLTLPGSEWLPGLVSRLGVTRSVRDATAIFAGVSKALNSSVNTTTLLDGRTLKIAAIDTPLHGRSCNQDIIDAFERALSTCERAGHEIHRCAWPFDGSALQEAFFCAWGALAKGYIGLLADTMKRPLDHALLEPWTNGLLEKAETLSADEIAAASKTLKNAEAAYHEMFQTFDVVMTPVYAKRTPLIGEHATTLPFEECFARVTDGVAFTPVQNMAGAPAISVPFADMFAPDALPIGVQFSGTYGDDEKLLALGAQLESHAPWPQLAPIAQSA